jgi:hypothetical protein
MGYFQGVGSEELPAEPEDGKMKVESFRKQFAALRAFSGLEASAFEWRCRAAFGEWQDGEGQGEEPTPEQWVRFAAEVAWEEGTRCGRDKAAEKKLQAACEAFWKTAAKAA